MNNYFSDRGTTLHAVTAGCATALLEKRPTIVDAVRYCAAIRNFHRFHYDQTYIATQGIENVIVPGFLMGNWCIEAVSRTFSELTDVYSLKFRNTSMAPLEERYLIVGRVVEVSTDATGRKAARCELEVKRSSNEQVVTTATVGVRSV